MLTTLITVTYNKGIVFGVVLTFCGGNFTYFKLKKYSGCAIIDTFQWKIIIRKAYGVLLLH